MRDLYNTTVIKVVYYRQYKCQSITIIKRMVRASEIRAIAYGMRALNSKSISSTVLHLDRSSACWQVRGLFAQNRTEHVEIAQEVVVGSCYSYYSYSSYLVMVRKNTYVFLRVLFMFSHYSTVVLCGIIPKHLPPVMTLYAQLIVEVTVHSDIGTDNKFFFSSVRVACEFVQSRECPWARLFAFLHVIRTVRGCWGYKKHVAQL